MARPVPDPRQQIVALAVRLAGTKGALAAKLGIDHKTLAHLGGATKLATVRALADHLNLPLDVVAERLIGEPREAPNATPVRVEDGYEGARELYLRALAEGRAETARAAAQHMARLAGGDSRRRAEALSCLSGAVEQQGHYTEAVEHIRAAKLCDGLGDGLRMRLEVNLASYLLELWQLSEARGVARLVQDWYRRHPPRADQQYRRVNQALAEYVAGFARLFEVSLHAERAGELAPRARAELARSRELHAALAADFPEERWYASIALSSEAGVTWAEVECGVRAPAAAIEGIAARLPVDLDEIAHRGQHLEAFGRWCIVGAQIACAHAGAGADRAMALFLGKAADIAGRTGNWSLWERVFTLELFRRSTLADYDARPERVWQLDRDEQRVLLGLMGRFPHFRRTAWRVLAAARIGA